MKYGSAMVEKVIDGRKHVIRVRVAVERPGKGQRSYIRLAKGIAEHPVSTAAWDGGRFARHKVDVDYFGIEVQEINGDLDSPDAPTGAALACAVATWIAYGVDWDDGDLVETRGWSIRRPLG